MRAFFFARRALRYSLRFDPALGILLTCSTLAFAATASLCLADDIYLKNGRKIVAAITREDPKQVFFERGGAEIALPRTMIDRIEKAPPPEAKPAAALAAGKALQDLPLPPAPSVQQDPGQTPVTRGGAIDETYLERLDNEYLRNPSAQARRYLVQAYQEAAIFLTRKGDPEAAIEKYHHALKFAADDFALNLALGYLEVKQNHAQEAVDLLLPLEGQNPKDPDIPMLLGSAYYKMEKLDQAIEEWRRALAIAPNDQLREALTKVERERNVAASYLELRSEHFLLRCQDNAARALGEQVLKSLETSFLELESDLDVYPRETVVVVLYPDQAFQDITVSPSWVGALNDGKVRIPVSGLTGMTPELARVLKHELTHSFVRQVTLGHCPVWFNEGIAQYEEGARTADGGGKLARAFRDTPKLSELEGSFLGFQREIVGLAYAKSLAAVEYLHDTYGIVEIRQLLKSMSATADLSSILQSEFRFTYSGLEDAVAGYVQKRYGSQN